MNENPFYENSTIFLIVFIHRKSYSKIILISYRHYFLGFRFFNFWLFLKKQIKKKSFYSVFWQKKVWCQRALLFVTYVVRSKQAGPHRKSSRRLPGLNCVAQSRWIFLAGSWLEIFFVHFMLNLVTSQENKFPSFQIWNLLD